MGGGKSGDFGAFWGLQRGLGLINRGKKGVFIGYNYFTCLEKLAIVGDWEVFARRFGGRQMNSKLTRKEFLAFTLPFHLFTYLGLLGFLFTFSSPIFYTEQGQFSLLPYLFFLIFSLITIGLFLLLHNLLPGETIWLAYCLTTLPLAAMIFPGLLALFQAFFVLPELFLQTFTAEPFGSLYSSMAGVIIGTVVISGYTGYKHFAEENQEFKGFEQPLTKKNRRAFFDYIWESYYLGRYGYTYDRPKRKIFLKLPGLCGGILWLHVFLIFWLIIMPAIEDGLIIGPGSIFTLGTSLPVFLMAVILCPVCLTATTRKQRRQWRMGDDF